jgi:hypothetical protein
MFEPLKFAFVWSIWWTVLHKILSNFLHWCLPVRKIFPINFATGKVICIFEERNMHYLLKTLVFNFKISRDNYRKHSRNTKFVTIKVSHSLTSVLIRSKNYPFTDFFLRLIKQVYEFCEPLCDAKCHFYIEECLHRGSINYEKYCTSLWNFSLN